MGSIASCCVFIIVLMLAETPSSTADTWREQTPSTPQVVLVFFFCLILLGYFVSLV